jgi:predicted metal-dependent hydrolase
VQADRIVSNRTDWIRKHRERILSRVPAISHFYDEGDIFFLFGRPYRLKIIGGPHTSIRISEDQLICCIGSRGPGPDAQSARRAFVREKIRQWYAQQARVFFLKMIAQLTREHPQLQNQEADNSVRIRLMKRRWGSCDKTGKVTCNTQLLCAPEQMIRYVMIHELCHRVYFNHKKEFYNLLQSYIPEYKELEKQLHEGSGNWRI